MADISKITLPNGTTYDIKDAVARQTLSGAIKIKGTTTTALSDESTTNPITISGDSYTAVANDAVFYSKKEYVFDGTKWHEFGDMSGLGALAYKDAGYVELNTSFEASGYGTVPDNVLSIDASPSGDADTDEVDYTPTGTVSQPTFSGSSMTSTGNFTPSGSIAVNEASGSGTSYTPAGTISVGGSTGTSYTPAGSISVGGSTGTGYTPVGSIAVNETSGSGTSYTPAGTIAVNASTGSGTSYTPEGTVSAPTISVATGGAGSTTTIHNPTKATVATAVTAAAPGATAPSNSVTYYSVSNETLSLYQIGYSTGDSITTSDVTVKTGDASYTASTPTFTGTEKKLAFTGTEKKLAFSGTQTKLDFSGTATKLDFSGTTKKLAFSGTQGSVSVTGTPEGTVSQPTFTGGTVRISAEHENDSQVGVSGGGYISGQFAVTFTND